MEGNQHADDNMHYSTDSYLHAGTYSDTETDRDEYAGSDY